MLDRLVPHVGPAIFILSTGKPWEDIRRRADSYRSFSWCGLHIRYMASMCDQRLAIIEGMGIVL